MSKMVSSDFNLTKLSTKELSDNLRATIEIGGSIFIVARRGTGKSMIAKQTVKASGLKEIYFNLSCFERPDVNGFPLLFKPNQDKYVEYLMPHFFKDLMEGDTKCVIIADELDKCSNDLLAPLLEIIQFRTINGKPLKNLHAFIATGNLQSESGSRPALPLLDRCEKYLVESSHSQWLDWAAKDGRIHPSIAAYISDHPEDLFGDVDPGDIYADPSPRGWHNASNILNFGEAKKWNHKILATKVSGCIGKKVGIKYSAYFDHYQVLLPIVEKVMRGEEIKGFGNLEQGKQIVACMIVCSRLSRILDDMKPGKKELPNEVDTVGSFLHTIDPEMSLIGVRSQIGLEKVVNNGIDEHPLWDKLLRDLVRRINA